MSVLGGITQVTLATGQAWKRGAGTQVALERHSPTLEGPWDSVGSKETSYHSSPKQVRCDSHSLSIHTIPTMDLRHDHHGSHELAEITVVSC